MLRINIYNEKKKKGLNEFFKKEHDPNDMIYCEIININIKKGNNFDIIKDDLLKTYIMTFKNIIIIHLEQDEYNDFIYLYKNSEEYLFDIYTTINYKDKVIYHIFCINKYLNEINYESFIKGNECSYKYDCLTTLYGSNLVINKRFSSNKFSSKYIFVETIGKNKCKKINFIKLIVNLINKYYLDYLPVHYLNI